MHKITITNKRVPNCIDVTSHGLWQLSPFFIRTDQNIIFENFWQFSKVYKCHLDSNGQPNKEWYKWRYDGFKKNKAVRYPMGKGAVPEYSYFRGKKYNYIEARKFLYIPYYIGSVNIYSEHFIYLEKKYKEGNIVLFDYDGYDRQEMTLEDVLNCETKKMGHAFVLEMILEYMYGIEPVPAIPSLCINGLRQKGFHFSSLK
jgi:hypothetical protein